VHLDRGADEAIVEVPVHQGRGIPVGHLKHGASGFPVEIDRDIDFAVVFRVDDIHISTVGCTGAIRSKGWQWLIKRVFIAEIPLLHRRKDKPRNMLHVAGRFTVGTDLPLAGFIQVDELMKWTRPGSGT